MLIIKVFKLWLLVYYPISWLKNQIMLGKEIISHLISWGEQSTWGKEARGTGHWFRCNNQSRQDFQDCRILWPKQPCILPFSWQFHDTVYMSCYCSLKQKPRKSQWVWVMSASFTTFWMRDQIKIDIQEAKFLSSPSKHRARYMIYQEHL